MKKFIIGYYRKCDFLTMASIASAFLGILLAIKGHFLLATLCMLLCGLCDAFDGRLARKYEYEENAKVYGVQLDSLADVICFGAFPAILTAMQSSYKITYIVCCFYLLCGVIRLAYFNTMACDENAEKNVYIGVPITTASIVYPTVLILTRLIKPNVVHIVMPIILAILGILFILRIRIPKPDVAKIFRKIFNKYVVTFLLFPLFVVFVSDICFKLNFAGNSIASFFSTVKGHFLPFLFICLYVIAAFGALTAIIGNSKIAKIVSSVVLVLILVINDVKFAIMGIPLQLSDVNYLNPDNIQMMGNATATIGPWIFKVIIKAVVLSALCLLFILLDKKENTIRFKNLKKRIISIVLTLVLAVAPSILGACGSQAVLAVYGIDNNSITSLPQNNELYFQYGFYQGMFLDSISGNYTKPSGYNRGQIDSVFADAAANYQSGTWEKANVVFILSEAFTDLENLEEVTFKSSLTPNIDSYENDSDKLVLDLLVSTFGGASVNTEFEILTGSSLAIWPSNFIPYNSYYRDHNGSYAPNLIKEFNNNGYETIYLTPWGQTSYNSEYVYTLFGADKKIYGDSLTGAKKGYYYADASLMDDIFNQLKDTSEGNYKFIMSATAQNHFAYGYGKYPITAVHAESDTLTDEQMGMIKTYAQGIYDADHALNQLYENIQTLDVPTIIVFFGDHLPYIVDSQENKPYLDSAYFNTDNADLNAYREYTTKAVILTNFGAEITDRPEYLNASYLGAYILNKMDLEISDYFKFVDQARKVLPVFNNKCAYLNGQFTALDALDAKEAAVLKNLKFAKYRSFYDFMD